MTAFMPGLVWKNAYFLTNRMDFDLEGPSSLLRWKISVCFLTRRALLRQTEQREESPGGVADQSKLRPLNWKTVSKNVCDVAGDFGRISFFEEKPKAERGRTIFTAGLSFCFLISRMPKF